jgi:hypothetical protein
VEEPLEQRGEFIHLLDGNGLHHPTPAGFNVNVGLNKWGVGPDLGFIWTPEKKILGAKSKIWVEWGELDRSTTHNISGSFTFNGVTYAV